MMKTMQPIIIIGSGMAGYALARELRKLDKTTPITLVCADNGDSYAKPTLSNAFAQNKTAASIVLADAATMQQTLTITVLAQNQVTHINPTDNSITSVNAEQQPQTLTYSQLVLATGASPVILPIAGNAANQVLHVNHLIDYALLRQRLADCEATLGNKPSIAIIGAGLIGCEFANDLVPQGHEVTVIDIAKQPLGQLLPSDAANYFQHQLADIGVRFLLNTSVVNIDSQSTTDNRKLQLTLSDNSQLNVNVVLSAVGLKPNIHLAQHAGIDCNRGVRVNAYLQTNIDNIFALGDCAEVCGHVLPYVMPLMNQARALAKTLVALHTDEALVKTAVHYPAMPVAVKTPAIPLVVLPPPQHLANSINWHTSNTTDGMVLTAVDEHEQLQGFILLGKAAGKQRMVLAKQVPDVLTA